MTLIYQPFELLEQKIAKWAGYEPEQVVACSSGTAAIHLALEAFRLPPGSEVLCPDFTMIACARAITLAGLSPVFVDCDERLLIDNSLFIRNFGNAKAVIQVHVYGRKCKSLYNWFGWLEDGVKIIEDLAEAHGVKPDAATDAACWSFYRNKIIAGEEGGAVAFRNPDHARLARMLRSVGFTPSHDFRHIPRGHNYRLANLLALEILRNWDATDSLHPHRKCLPVGMSMMEWVWDERRRIEARYDAICPFEWKMPQRDVPWVYDFRIPDMTPGLQDRIVMTLRTAGIQARHGFYPMHLQEEYMGKCRTVLMGTRGKRGVQCDKFLCLPEQHPHHYTSEPNSVIASREVIYLPIFNAPGNPVAEQQITRSFEIIREVVGS